MLTLEEFMPPRAADWAYTVDVINAVITWATIFFTVVISGVMVYFAIKYRYREGKETAYIPHNITLETVWTVVPAIVCFVLFYFGFSLYSHQRTPPVDSEEIYVQARSWAWDFAYPGGKRSTNELVVPLNKPVRLIMKSKISEKNPSEPHVTHSFFIPAMRMKEDVIANAYHYMWFTPTQLGEFPIFCAEYCGVGHSAMMAKLKVVTFEEYQDYLFKKPAEQLPPLELGQKLYKDQQCVTCHSIDGSKLVGPSLKGIFGAQHKFTDGSTATVDENYLRESILHSSAKIVEGYPPIMPQFDGLLSDEDVEGLITFIKSLK